LDNDSPWLIDPLLLKPLTSAKNAFREYKETFFAYRPTNPREMLTVVSKTLKKTIQFSFRHFPFALILIAILSPAFVVSASGEIQSTFFVLFQLTVAFSYVSGEGPVLSFLHSQLSQISNIPFVGNRIEESNDIHFLSGPTGDHYLAVPANLTDCLSLLAYLLFLSTVFAGLVLYCRRGFKRSSAALFAAAFLELFWFLARLGIFTAVEVPSIPSSPFPPESPISMFVSLDVTFLRVEVFPVGIAIFIIASLLILWKAVLWRRSAILLRKFVYPVRSRIQGVIFPLPSKTSWHHMVSRLAVRNPGHEALASEDPREGEEHIRL
jgi:hypothetical protein